MRHAGGYLLSHWRLLSRVARSELVARFAGSLLGVGWAAATPLLLLAIYAAVYLLIFRVQAPNLSGPQYVVLIFSGLVPFLMTSECLVGGVSSVVANRAVLSNTVFPIELAPAKVVIIGQATMAAGMTAVLLMAAYLDTLSWTVLLMPVIWVLHMMFLIGLLWILSLVNLIMRDLQNFIGVVVMYLMIASPIAYTPEMVPPGMKLLLQTNPLAYFIIGYQDVIVFGRIPEPSLVIGLVSMSVITFALGGWFFSRAKKFLVDYA